MLLIPKLRNDGDKYGFTPTLTVGECISSARRRNHMLTCTPVSSGLHAFVAFNERKEPEIFSYLNDEKRSGSSMGSRYSLSKLLQVLALREITRQHPVNQLGCTLNLVSPGWCHSELGRELMTPVIAIIMKIMCRTTEVGSRTLVHAAISHGTRSHGMYLSGQEEDKVSPFVASSDGLETQKRVWHELASKLEEIQPGIMKNLEA